MHQRIDELTHPHPGGLTTTLAPRAAALTAALTPWATAATLATLIVPWHFALAPSPFFIVLPLLITTASQIIDFDTFEFALVITADTQITTLNLKTLLKAYVSGLPRDLLHICIEAVDFKNVQRIEREKYYRSSPACA